MPAGPFTMGSPGGSELTEDETPPHVVHVRAFRIDRFAVTNRQYRLFVTETGHRRPRTWADKRFNGDRQPVVGVDWFDAQAYCQWAGLRLPTEAEREKAARGGLEGKRYPWGDEGPIGRACVGQDSRTGAPVPVGSFAANGYGLFDMSGNVHEWCADFYGRSYYAESPGRDPTGPASGTDRVVRGGPWSYDAFSARCAHRGNMDPGHPNTAIGFRCVRPLE